MRRRPDDRGGASGGTSGSGTARGGHRLVAEPRRRRGTGLLSAPSLVGTAALVVATTGSLTLGAGGSDALSADASLVAASPLSASFGSSSTARSSGSGTVRQEDSALLSGRQRAVSRDSQRAAMKDAADEDLQAAAEAQAKQRNAALAQLAASAEKQAGLLAKDAWQLPITGGYRLTGRFGQCSSLWSHCHTGLDFAVPSGTPIHAVANGTVTEVGSAGAYGNRTIVTLEDGTETWYCHQSAFGVQTGQKVTGGQVIGAVGSTGNTTGPHLHLEVRPGGGDPVDPDQALVAHGLKP